MRIELLREGVGYILQHADSFETSTSIAVQEFSEQSGLRMHDFVQGIVGNPVVLQELTDGVNVEHTRLKVKVMTLFDTAMSLLLVLHNDDETTTNDEIRALIAMATLKYPYDRNHKFLQGMLKSLSKSR